MTKKQPPEKPLICDGCGHDFGLGDKIFLLHIAVIGRDYCAHCKDKIVSFLDSFHSERLLL